ncbi:hypothetical protein BC831DRAFT_448580 [Entophlyctis helioformis]|nr:hypothetical protein BC831DRAFT_448580 [Entophlyctis helioformis]
MVLKTDDWTVLAARHSQDITTLQHYLVDSITRNKTSLNLSSHELAHLAEIVVDKALLLRFLKKHKFNIAHAETALIAHIDWRLTHSLSQLCFETLSPRAISYLQQGLFQFWKTDASGHPVVHIAPRHFRPSSDGIEIEDLRMCVIFALDIVRRWLHGLNYSEPASAASMPTWATPTKPSTLSTAKVGSGSASSSTSSNGSAASDTQQPDPAFFQVLIVVDLNGFGVSNMNYELVPLFYEIFQKHFPQLIGQVLVLNYGWIHAGIWSMVRTALTADATERLRFISTKELPSHLPIENIPSAFGGTDNVHPLSPYICPIITSFGSTIPPMHETRLHAKMLARLSESDEPGLEQEDDMQFMTPPHTPTHGPSIRFAFGSNSGVASEVWHDAQSNFSITTSTTATPTQANVMASQASVGHAGGHAGGQSGLPTIYASDGSVSSVSGKPPKVKSAADLQVLLRVQEYRSGSGLSRTPSAKSLTSLTGFRMTPIQEHAAQHKQSSDSLSPDRALYMSISKQHHANTSQQAGRLLRPSVGSLRTPLTSQPVAGDGMNGRPAARPTPRSWLGRIAALLFRTPSSGSDPTSAPPSSGFTVGRPAPASRFGNTLSSSSSSSAPSVYSDRPKTPQSRWSVWSILFASRWRTALVIILSALLARRLTVLASSHQPRR